MLTAIFGTTDLAEVDWRQDPAYRQAEADEAEASASVHTLKQTADAFWAAAQMGSEIARNPSPGDRCWPARELWLAADRRWEDLKRAKATAEAAAKQKVQHIGAEAGRHKWVEAETEVFPRLIQWCREYGALRVEVQDKTGVLLPDVACACCLTEHDLSTFMDNARRSFEP